LGTRRTPQREAASLPEKKFIGRGSVWALAIRPRGANKPGGILDLASLVRGKFLPLESASLPEKKFVGPSSVAFANFGVATVSQSMEPLTYERVVDQLVNSLAEQRRLRLERQLGYIALAQAILAEDTGDLVDVAA